MQNTNKTIVSQIISGSLKFLAVVASILLVVVFIIPTFLYLIKGKDVQPVDDSSLRLQTIYISPEENAFFDLEKINISTDTRNIPAGKELVSDYLESYEWDQEAVRQLLADNEEGLQHFTAAAVKGKFQLPYTDDPAKISRSIQVTPLNSWRSISRVSGIKAIRLAKDGQVQDALDEALKAIIVGNAIENSQSLLITQLVGIAIKNTGLDVLQKVISIIPKDSVIPLEYRSELANYQAKGNAAPYAIEYLVFKQAVDRLGRDGDPEFGLGARILMKNKFYFKPNLTLSYYFDFFNKLAIESRKDCSEVKKVQKLIMPLEKNNLVKMYFTENLIGRHFYQIPDMALNNALENKCAAENKLQEIILMIDSRN